ncbi:alpha/beta fold hydrolase [Macrococcus brunensis]|uniref:alpha/beta fold hydrolase n=1 Tax=Macrococcus brunensis TaxID=198483 RepID=UPI001EF1178C|nr:alpha/beta hydrolase [Macrococcus brunensis]ULG71759.1 alpha/beta hydrolase [Macrococcus brunensis]
MSEFKSMDGTMINYESTGSGDPLIMIHGLNGNLKMFERTKESLAENYRVITYDVRGHGHSDRPADYTLDDHIDDCLELFTHLGIKKAHILGYSMGAYIALGLVTRYPRKVDKLILVGAKSNAAVSSFARIMMEHRNEIKNKSKKEALEILNNYIFYDKDKVKAWQSDVNQYSTLDANEEAVASRSISGFDYRDELSKVPNTTLLITGEYDQLNPPEESELIAQKIPNSQLVKFKYSGHAPLAEEPERFVEEVQSFLKQ